MRKYEVRSTLTALFLCSGMFSVSAFAEVCDGKPVNGVCEPPHLLWDVCPTNVPRGCYPMPSAVGPSAGANNSPLPQPKIKAARGSNALSVEKTPGFEAEYSGATGANGRAAGDTNPSATEGRANKPE